MTKKEAIKIFEEKKVRTVWDDENRGMVFLCSRRCRYPNR